MLVELLVIGGVIAVFIIGTLIAIRNEKKDYNNGTCPNCEKPLELFTTDSHGSRGYYCKKCEYFTWVSYAVVDKNHKGDKNG